MNAQIAWLTIVVIIFGCLIVRELHKVNETLESIEEALHEQLLYMGDDYIEELEDEMVKFDLPDSEFEQTVRVMPDGTFRIWYTEDGITWQYGATVDPLAGAENTVTY